MYKTASKSRQRGIDRGRLADWINGDEQMTDGDLYKSHLRAMDGIEQDILACVDKAKRKALGRRKFELQQEVHRLRSLLQMKRRVENGGIPHYFVDAARAILSRGQFQLILDMAKRNYDEEAAALRRLEGAEKMSEGEAKLR